jgi:hypothetical protein
MVRATRMEDYPENVCARMRFWVHTLSDHLPSKIPSVLRLLDCREFTGYPRAGTAAALLALLGGRHQEQDEDGDATARTRWQENDRSLL